MMHDGYHILPLLVADLRKKKLGLFDLGDVNVEVNLADVVPLANYLCITLQRCSSSRRHFLSNTALLQSPFLQTT